MPLLTSPRPLYRHLYGDIFEMGEVLEYEDNDTGEVYEVEASFVWNKASIIKWVPRALVPHGDEFTYPSAVHDQFYKEKNVPRRRADRVMRQFLIEEFDRAIAIQSGGEKITDYVGRGKAWTAWSIVRMNLLAAFRWEKTA